MYLAHQTVPFLIADVSKRYRAARVHCVVGSIVFCEASRRVGEATDELVKLHPKGAIVLDNPGKNEQVSNLRIY